MALEPGVRIYLRRHLNGLADLLLRLSWLLDGRFALVDVWITGDARRHQGQRREPRAAASSPPPALLCRTHRSVCSTHFGPPRWGTRTPTPKVRSTGEREAWDT